MKKTLQERLAAAIREREDMIDKYGAEKYSYAWDRLLTEIGGELGGAITLEEVADIAWREGQMYALAGER